MSDTAAIRKEFLGRIVFRPSDRKLSSCMRFLRIAWPDGSPDDLRLALLIAEGSHMSTYGRPVTGCQYLLSDGTFSHSIEAVEAEDAVEEGEERIHPIDDIDAMEDMFPDLSGSDIEYMRKASSLCASDRSAADAIASGWVHDGNADYALMVEEDNPEILHHKLEDLAFWGRYFYLGK
jgi:hypothetical protein